MLASILLTQYGAETELIETRRQENRPLVSGEEIVGTLSAVETFLGAILVISTVQYNKDNK